MAIKSSRLDNLTVRTKLILLGLSAIVVILVLSGAAYRSVEKLRAIADAQVGPAAQLRQQMVIDMMHDGIKGDVYVALYQTSTDYLAGHGGKVDPALKQQVLSTFNSNKATMQEGISFLQKANLDDASRRQFLIVEPQLRTYMEAATTTITKAFESHEAATAQLPEFLQLFSVLEKSLDELGDTIEAQVSKASDDANSASRSASKVNLATAAAGLVLLITMLWVISMSVIRRTRLMNGFLNEIGRGNFSNEIPLDGKDEIGRMLATLGTVQTSLSDAAIKAAESAGKISAIRASAAVVEFNMDGQIIDANDIFLSAMGYARQDVVGQHHAMFMSPEDRSSPAYQHMWAAMRRGEPQGGVFRRLAKGGREVWIHGTYSPVKDQDGKFVKVVKFANDVTDQVQLSEMMKKSVQQASELTEAAGGGDLTHRIDLSDKKGALQTLCSGINGLVDMLAGVVRDVKSASAEVSRGSAEIAQGNANLSQRTEEQSSSLEETASSMEEMTSTVKQNADNAAQANQLAAAARDQAEKGGAVVGKAVSAMGEINESSRKIADIIGVIDEIAFQTNLLALNAAVEAARAGEQGRGFAVVASEVRNLAGRSATAAKEIKALIEDSVRRVEDGSQLVVQSGQTLEQIVSAVKKVSDIVAEIAAASSEQSSGIEQVNKAVMQLDEMTQQNAALVEQATAASQSMAEQAGRLDQSMSRYRLDEDELQQAEAGAAARAA